MPADDSAVAVRNLRVVRGGYDVLRDVSVRVAKGSVTGLIGPSGSGKSTLMRSLVGVQIVRSGTITVLGLPAGSRELRRRIGYSTQTPAVYADLTPTENLRYFASVLGAPAGDVERVCAEVGLTSQEDRPTGGLSGGQRSRVSLAVALLGKPEVLVLDEPTVGLDPLLREELWTLFNHLAGDRGVTLFVSSHVMEEAERCHDLILMRDGKILVQEAPASLLRRTGATGLDEAFLKLVRVRPEDATLS